MTVERIDYGRDRLDEAEVDPDPMAQFDRWFAEALSAGVAEPNAMTLATIGDSGPDARIVLLKGADPRGFTFYTDYRSAKGRELEQTPRAALVFFWQSLERQVRIRGAVERVSEAESDEYFATRPAGSRIGAWASCQSSVLPNRGALEAALVQASARFDGRTIDRPSHWGGFRVVPETIEFWQGRENRLHDRIRYHRETETWTRERLSP